jgi:hypothetical protein
MRNQPHSAVPAHVIESLDASVRDVEAGDLHDAEAVQAQALGMLAGYARARTASAKSRVAKVVLGT